jgi:hypothetical protein
MNRSPVALIVVSQRQTSCCRSVGFRTIQHGMTRVNIPAQDISALYYHGEVYLLKDPFKWPMLKTSLRNCIEKWVFTRCVFY